MDVGKRPEQRFDFSALPQRKKWSLPAGKRIAVYTVVNVEEWDIEKPVAREYVTSPAGVQTVPNIPNWAWHEYGMRVGIWRILDFFDRCNLSASTAINARVCLGSDEPVAAAMKEAGVHVAQSPAALGSTMAEVLNGRRVHANAAGE